MNWAEVKFFNSFVCESRNWFMKLLFFCDADILPFSLLIFASSDNNPFLSVNNYNWTSLVLFQVWHNERWPIGIFIKKRLGEWGRNRAIKRKKGRGRNRERKREVEKWRGRERGQDEKVGLEIRDKWCSRLRRRFQKTRKSRERNREKEKQRVDRKRDEERRKDRSWQK